MIGSTSKGPALTQPTDAPLMNTLQPVGQPIANLNNASAQLQAPQQQQPNGLAALQKMIEPQKPNFSPAQFGAPNASGNQLSQFLAALMKNQGGSNGV